jgi:xylan 1,4-beta-xylosidase
MRRHVWRATGLLVRVALLPLLSVPLLALAPLAVAATPSDLVVIDPFAAGAPFPHFWERMFGSGRAILALRAQYRADLRAVRAATGFGYARFHDILDDEVGVYDEDQEGNPTYNFSYVDQIYDGLLADGVRPFVELSFMPHKLAARQDEHAFWYRQIVAPPKDYARWDALVRAFARHLVARYGLAEVSQWYFEVWNEPNIDFWTGDPKQATYFELYDHTARAIKAVNPRLRIGGPATSSAHWVDDFLRHVAAAHVPVDFISSHAYADDTNEDLFGPGVAVPVEQRVCRAIEKVRGQIRASALPRLPLMWTEWNVPSYGELNARDTPYLGAALAYDIAQCDGLVEMMSFWTFSDEFDEGGPARRPFDGSFGLVTLGGIRKPSWTAFALLHGLGNVRVPVSGEGALATRRADGSLAVALWNLSAPTAPGGAREVRVQLAARAAGWHARVKLLDDTHGNSLTAYRTMGSPRYPTRAQVEALNRAAELPMAGDVPMDAAGALHLVLPASSLALLELLPPPALRH